MPSTHENTPTNQLVKQQMRQMSMQHIKATVAFQFQISSNELSAQPIQKGHQ